MEGRLVLGAGVMRFVERQVSAVTGRTCVTKVIRVGWTGISQDYKGT